MKEGSIPCIFPDGPKYLSSNLTSRESPEKKKMKREINFISEAVKNSLITKQEYDSKRKFKNLEEMQNCLKYTSLSDFWTVLVKEKKNCFFKLGH